MTALYLGLDCATESVRGLLIDDSGKSFFKSSHPLAQVAIGDDGSRTQDPRSWVHAIESIIAESTAFAAAHSHEIASLSLSCTSGTFLIADTLGNPVAPAAMYNDGRASDPLGRARMIVKDLPHGNYHLAHTSEFVIAALTEIPLQEIPTDWSHALKTGVDLDTQNWKSSSISLAQELGITLPALVAPGTLIGRTKVGGIPIYAGMTDGCTAQISVGSSAIGSAVTTMGTTLVMKIVSPKSISGPGFYSHLLPGNRWLGGAASNLGGISFSEFHHEITEWDQKASESGISGLVTYPLSGKGERFPISNSQLQWLQNKEPKSQIEKYRAILEGIAFAERLSFEKLAKAGAPLTGVHYSVGGGSRSQLWNQIRATVLTHNLTLVQNAGSDLGSAMIAAASHSGGDLALGLDRFNSSTLLEVEPVKGDIEKYEAKYQEFLSLVAPFQNEEIR